MQPKVAILMAVFEDGRFLPEQLSSIRTQDHGNLDVWISRDCDGGHVGGILEEQAPAFGTERFFVLRGPNRGSAANFLSMVMNPDIRAGYFAYSDQDDVWERDKLSRAIARLETVPPAVPALYGSRTRLIDGNGLDLGLSPFHGRPPGFRNALVQNIAGGNTMVMNRAAREVLIDSGVGDALLHDWWTYMIVAGAGGRVFYDLHPSVRYRQHDRNLTGVPRGSLTGCVRRLRRILRGRVREANRSNVRLLHRARDLLTRENRDVLDLYSDAIESLPFTRLSGIRRSGVYRQTRIGSIGLLAAALLGKL